MDLLLNGLLQIPILDNVLHAIMTKSRFNGLIIMDFLTGPRSPL